MAKKPATTIEPSATQEAPAKAKAPAFVFVGDAQGHGPEKITLFGLAFAKNGKPVTVEDEKAAAKLAGNSHFKAA